MPGHSCPICRADAVPDFRALCGACYKPLPRRLAATLIAAWRRRVIEPARYEETLIATLLWYRDNADKRPEVRI